jgi:hypothetical protein
LSPRDESRLAANGVAKLASRLVTPFASDGILIENGMPLLIVRIGAKVMSAKIRAAKFCPDPALKGVL